jgi:hypothetical protein
LKGWTSNRRTSDVTTEAFFKGQLVKSQETGQEVKASGRRGPKRRQTEKSWIMREVWLQEIQE